MKSLLSRFGYWTPSAILLLVGFLVLISSDTPYIFLMLIFFAFMQNIAFSLVSRARNRNNDHYHLVAAAGSNGIWFLTFTQLVRNGMTFDLLIPFLVGTVFGSLCGASVSASIERRLNIKADVFEKKERLSRAFWQKVFYISPFAVFLGAGMFFMILLSSKTIFYMACFAYLQNVSFALSSRARNRSSNWYIIFTSLLSGVFWFVTFKHLLINDMAYTLMVPYAVGTVFGSLTGARTSMVIERAFRIRPDEHIKLRSDSGGAGIFMWIFPVLIAYFLWVLRSPIPFVLLGAASVFFLEKMAHTVASRAGNRNHMNYHLCARVFNGIVFFMTYKIVVSYNMSFELFIPVVTGMVLGGLFAKGIGEKIETRIGAVMDVR